jgi:hypothetical protein
VLVSRHLLKAKPTGAYEEWDLHRSHQLLGYGRLAKSEKRPPVPRSTLATGLIKIQLHAIMAGKRFWVLAPSLLLASPDVGISQYRAVPVQLVGQPRGTRHNGKKFVKTKTVTLF